jgi:glycosyltransferase involved in cell wall biosynthesis
MKDFELLPLSVVIPVRNRQKMIVRAISSVASQLGKDDQIIIVDDCSTDSTKDVVAALSLDDKRITLLKNSKNKGAPAARNLGLKAASRDWIAFLDSDNQWLDGFLIRFSEAVRANPGFNVFTCHSHIVKDDQAEEQPEIIGSFEWTPSGKITRDLLVGETYVDTSSAIIQRSKLLEIGGWDESCPSFQEWDLHIRLSENSLYFCIPEFFVNYCHHDNQMSRDEKRTVDGLAYNMRKHKEKWNACLANESWLKRCFELDDRIDSLESEKFSRSLNAFLLEPRLIKYRLRKIASRILRKVKRF